MTANIHLYRHACNPRVSACSLLIFVAVRIQELVIVHSFGTFLEKKCFDFWRKHQPLNCTQQPSRNSGRVSINIWCVCRQYADILIVIKVHERGMTGFHYFCTVLWQKGGTVLSVTILLTTRDGELFLLQKIPTLHAAILSSHLCTVCCTAVNECGREKYYPVGYQTNGKANHPTSNKLGRRRVEIKSICKMGRKASCWISWVLWMHFSICSENRL